MKLFAIGLWVTLVALGTAYAAAVVMPGMAAKKAAAAPVLQYTKTRVLNVPMIANGAVQGFMAVQLGFTTDAAALKDVHVPPEVYVTDEAFRAVYTDPTLDFRNLARYDLGALTKHLVETTNSRFGTPVVKDVMIEQFSYVGKDTGKDPGKG